MIKVTVRSKTPERLERSAERVPATVATAVFETAALLQTKVRANASSGTHAPGEPHIPGTGPGPNVATGNYRRSIQLKTGFRGGLPIAVVYSNAPQAARLEYGFLPPNIDSLGRGFNQPAYPHWRPAVEEFKPLFDKALRKAVDEAL